MTHFWRLGIRRALLIWLSLGLLYFLAFAEMAVFVRYQSILTENKAVLYYAIALLLLGFGLGILVVQALVCRSFSHEAGDFETLGFTRLAIASYYGMQNLFIVMAALLPATPIYFVLALLEPLRQPTAVFERVVIAQGLLALAFVLSFALLIWLALRPSPALLLKLRN
ncbi:MAG: hypothetical protein N2Z22_02585 [Turneriella sp.]|nr:hypothetical protein [Leptospiraceae bacterium]MCX7632203.1 hypothetical protein [Turneriella sp.]